MLLAAALLAASSAQGRSLEFTETAPTDPLAALALPEPKLGVTGTIKFRLDAKDRKAAAAAKQKAALLARRDKHVAASVLANQRIIRIKAMLLDVQGDEEALRAEIEARMVERYKDGDAGDLEFLLSGDGLSDLVARHDLLKDQTARDRRTWDRYQVTIQRIEEYQQVLEELQEISGEQADRLDERANRLDDVLVAARVGHDEAPDQLAPKKQQGIDGTWYVMDGAFQAQLFLPSAGSGYTGGTRTPARAATPQQIGRVLGDDRIDLDASGYSDVLSGQIDGRLLDALSLAAERFKYVKVTSLKSDHGVYTSSGNVSAHSYGCAADIGTIGSTHITPGSQTPGGEVDQAVRFFASLGMIKGSDLGPHQVISLFDHGGATLAMGDHGDHIHLGYAC